jgi:hypothetical protein
MRRAGKKTARFTRPENQADDLSTLTLWKLNQENPPYAS